MKITNRQKALKTKGITSPYQQGEEVEIITMDNGAVYERDKNGKWTKIELSNDELEKEINATYNDTV